MVEQEGFEGLMEKCLGLGTHKFQVRVGNLIWSVPDMLQNDSKL